ncbi:Gfo/Idh/MocA family protein [Paenarthrobacter sp. YAF11_1]|uniref:Gfo/Idh/MocA family protein n=1 Tax=Paenarthrobacter sp. YAF11_1 TaxID=3233074 RepID=UPI003F9596BC
MSGTKLRWGVVGTGGICRKVVPDLQGTENAELVAVASRDQGRAGAFAEEFSIPTAYGAFELMLQDPDIDAVYIGTPHGVHHRMVSDALRAGKHVVCEKPLALNAAQVKDLTALAAEFKVFLMEAMWMKFNPVLTAISEVISSGKIGEVRSVRASFGLPFPEDGSNRWQPGLGGSALLDQGIYPVTLAHTFLGRPEKIQATGTVRPSGIDVAEAFTFGYEDGRFAQGASSMVEFLDLTASINGTKGWVTIAAPFWDTSEFTVHAPTFQDVSASETVVLEREGNGYVPMFRAASQAILDGSLEHPVHTWSDATEVFEIMDEIRLQLQ